MLTVFSVLCQVLLALGVVFIILDVAVYKISRLCRYHHLAEKISKVLTFLIAFVTIIFLSLLTVFWR